MFDDITRSETPRGFRGFVYRHFAPSAHPEIAKHEHRAEAIGTGIGVACAMVLLLAWAIVAMSLSLGPCGFSETPPWWRAWLLVIPVISVPVGLYAWNRSLMRGISADG
jgi:hypothetical protein